MRRAKKILRSLMKQKQALDNLAEKNNDVNSNLPQIEDKGSYLQISVKENVARQVML